MGSRHQILLENLSRRSALPETQLSTIPTESNFEIVNLKAMTNGEISAQWAR